MADIPSDWLYVGVAIVYGNTRSVFTLYVYMDVSYFLGEHSTVPCHLEFFVYLSSEIPRGLYHLISKHQRFQLLLGASILLGQHLNRQNRSNDSLVCTHRVGGSCDFECSHTAWSGSHRPGSRRVMKAWTDTFILTFPKLFPKLFKCFANNVLAAKL